ncbi:unnamed protein product [Amaranthus hypochondriacus]
MESRKLIFEQYGPYGNQYQKEIQRFSMKIEGNEIIKEVIIRHGKCIDAIGFVAGGLTVTSGALINNESKIKLRKGEFITKISGTSGEYTYAGHDRVICTLKIYTNFNRKGYGPFGTGEDTKNITAFSSPDELEGRFVGFFGNAPGFIYSLGIYAERATKS